ncbi:Putative transposase of IS4/5 family [Carnobacterium iners]|nr:Putative transposase of IS4/5 family [Carnobacterium iners]
MSIEWYKLTDEQWNQMKNLFPPYRTGRPPKNIRIMFNAIL